MFLDLWGTILGTDQGSMRRQTISHKSQMSARAQWHHGQGSGYDIEGT